VHNALLVNLTHPENIRDLLAKAGITQSAFGRWLGVDNRTVRRWVVKPDSHSYRPITSPALRCLELLADPDIGPLIKDRY
jgi:DNA-binding transcriptional regulator YiaG